MLNVNRYKLFYLLYKENKIAYYYPNKLDVNESSIRIIPFFIYSAILKSDPDN